MRTAQGVDPTPQAHEEMIQRVITTGQKTGCPTGIHAMDPQSALARAQQGMQFIAVGSDLRMLVQKSQETLKAIMPEKAAAELARY